MSNECVTSNCGIEAAPRSEAVVLEPSADIFETAEAYQLTVDVPGATAEAVTAQVENGLLRVTAEANLSEGRPTLERPAERVRYERRFRLGKGVDDAGIAASLNDGVLTLRVPKAETSKPRRIEVISQN